MPAPDDLCIYATDHPHSQVICRALSIGSGGRVVPPLRLLDGPAAVYGVLRGCDRIIKECEWVGRDYFHVDHGYFKRGHYGGYYRISRNGLQWDGRAKNHPPDRWKRLGISLRPWRKSGRSVVVCPLSAAIGHFFGIDTHRWLEATINEIQLYTDRPVLIKAKDSEVSLRETLLDAWCLVAHTSNAATEALVEGIPVFVLGPAASKPMGLSDLTKVETPVYPDREPWLNALAYQQWDLSEIRRGECWDWI